VSEKRAEDVSTGFDERFCATGSFAYLDTIFSSKEVSREVFYFLVVASLASVTKNGKRTVYMPKTFIVNAR
jgi:hypothetical protein